MGKKQAYNPYLPSYEYIPDGEPHLFGDRVYVYGSHDLYNGYVFCQGDYVCYSAPKDDLSDWRYEGVIYPRNEDPVNKEGKMCLYAPDVTIGPDGRYYLYYVLDKVGFVSVCVCDEPAGRYEFYGYVHYEDGVRLGDKEGDIPQFDPAVITENNKTYMYTGFCGFGDKSRPGAMVTVLKEDMLTIEKAPEIIVPGSMYSQGTEYEGHAFFEASSIRKINGTYYFVFSSQVMHELCYAMSDSPLGPFKYGGVIVSNCDLHIDTYKPADMPAACGGNNHGGILTIGDDHYIFYHRQTNGTWFSRQGCAEKIEILEDGSIPQVEITSCGLNGGPLKGEGFIPGHVACHLFVEDRPSKYTVEAGYPKIMMDGKDGDENPGFIGNFVPGSIAGFKYFDCKGITKFSITYRGYGHGKFEIRTKWDGECLGSVEIDNSNVWEEVWGDAAIPDGINSIYVKFVGGGNPSVLGVGLK